ncbi:hypothetical protein QR685DRAFT_571596 [Neurospora intermedia]|uniref:Uncharacterized protein n=1 Tax=Neurospora intermedia TaxID=5142 RepID=A0ABR3DCS3_NEUIN
MTARDRREPTRGLLLVSAISCDRSLFKGELHDPFQYQFIHLAVGNGVKRFWRYCHLLTGRQVPFLAHSHHMGVCSFMLIR